jgi:peptidoglycan/xylan/chitin deacetylase (PgdA/CDA1 family)
MFLPRLTFDDGPSESTGAILDLLAEHDVHAHFFVIGMRAQERPDLIERTAAEGHVIGNHTWDHAGLAAIRDDADVIEKLARTSDVITKTLGAPPTLFRAPYGSVDARVERLAATLGLTHMGWDVVTQDFSAPDVETIREAILDAEQGEIVLMHDGNGDIPNGPSGRPKTVQALAETLTALREPQPRRPGSRGRQGQ